MSQGAYLGVSPTRTLNVVDVKLASLLMGALLLLAPAQLPKLVAFNTQEWFMVDICTASRVPGTSPQMPGLPGNNTLHHNKQLNTAIE